MRKCYLAPLVDGGSVELKLFNPEDNLHPCALDINSIRKGLQILSSDYRRHWKNFRTGDGDGETGDVFVQCCVFGDVVFG